MNIKIFQVTLVAYRKMSDTDSAVLAHPLPDHLVGNDLGQMKLVHKIKKGVFIRKKLYYILNSDNKEIIKSSGIDSSKLDYNLFLDLLKGKSITIERINFKVQWKDFTLKIINSNITVNGLKGEIKINKSSFAVSFPIKYSIIIHPLYPIEIKNIKFKENNSLIMTKKSESLLTLKEKLIIIIFLISLLSTFLLLLLKIFI